MNPYETENRDFKVVAQVGQTLAEEVLRIYPSIQTTRSPRLAVQSRRLDYQPRQLPEGKESIVVSFTSINKSLPFSESLLRTVLSGLGEAFR